MCILNVFIAGFPPFLAWLGSVRAFLVRRASLAAQSHTQWEILKSAAWALSCCETCCFPSHAPVKVRSELCHELQKISEKILYLERVGCRERTMGLWGEGDAKRSCLCVLCLGQRALLWLWVNNACDMICLGMCAPLEKHLLRDRVHPAPWLLQHHSPQPPAQREEALALLRR